MSFNPLPSKCLTLSAIALLGAALMPAAHAQTWPSKSVTMVVPYSAGGPTDALARLLAKKLGADLGQTVLVDNRAGAGERSAWRAWCGPRLMATPFLPRARGRWPECRTDEDAVRSNGLPVRELDRTCSAVIVAGAGTGIVSLQDLVKKAKAAPGKLNYGSAGNGTTPHIGMELLKQEAGIDLLHVPYKGAAPAVTALLGGEVQVAMLDAGAVLQHIQSGKLKVLAIAGGTRAAQIPDAPTTGESGLPGVLMDTNYGVIVPKGTSQEIVRNCTIPSRRH